MIRELSAHKHLLRALGVAATAALSVCVLLSSALVHGGGTSFWLQFSAFVLFARPGFQPGMHTGVIVAWPTFRGGRRVCCAGVGGRCRCLGLRPAWW